MSKYIIDDAFLYRHLKSEEDKILDALPKEEDLNHQFSKGFERKMKALIKQEKRTPFMKNLVIFSRRAAAIFSSIAFAITMSVEAYRIHFFKTITEIKEEFTSIIFFSKGNVDSDKLTPILPEYVPMGFELTDQKITQYTNTAFYHDNNGDEIYYLQKVLTQSEIIIDTEKADEWRTLDYSGYTLNILLNKNTYKIYWNDDYYFYSLTGNTDEQALLSMAKSIIEKK